MRVLLVEDHPLVHSGLRGVLRELDNNVNLAWVDTAAQARELLSKDSRFELLLLDLDLRDGVGFSLLNELRTTYPLISLVVLSASDANGDVMRAISCGAMGYVPKRASIDVLVGALRMAMSGHVFVPPMALRSQAAPVPALPATDWGTREHIQTRRSAAALGLTPRQTDVLQLLLEGRSNKLIARSLNLSVETIKDHVGAVLRALNVTSRTQAILAVDLSTRSSSAHVPSELSLANPAVRWRQGNDGAGHRIPHLRGRLGGAGASGE